MDLDRIQRALSALPSGTASPAATEAAPEPPPAAPTPPASASLLDRIGGALSQLSNPTAADEAAASRRRSAAAASAANTVLKTGQAVPATPTFDPPATGLKDYLHAFSGGRLALPNYEDHALDAKAAKHFTTWALENPVQAATARAHPETRDRLHNLFRAVVALNDTPATPAEQSDAWTSLLREWQTAQFSPTQIPLPGSVTGETVAASSLPADFNPSQIPPDAARRVLAKVRYGETDALNVMERGIYNALGGEHFRKFVEDNERRAVVNLRHTRLTGVPEPAPEKPRALQWAGDRTTPADGVTPDVPYHLGRLTGVSPLAHGLALAGTRAAGEQADILLERNRILGGPELARVGEYFTNKEYRAEPARFARLAFVDLPAAVLSYGSAGIIPSLFEKAGSTITQGFTDAQRDVLKLIGTLKGDDTGAYNHAANAASFDRDWKRLWSALGRHAYSTKGDAAAQLQATFDAFPAADADARADAAFSVFNANTWVRDSLDNAAKYSPTLAGKLLGLDNPAVQEEVAKLGAGLLNADDAGAFAVGLGMLGLGAKSARAHLKRSGLRFKEPGKLPSYLTKEEVAAIEAAPPAVALAQHAVLTDAVFTHLRTLDDPNAAVAIAGRLADKLAEVPGLDAETYGAVTAAIDTVRREVDKHGTASGLTPEARGSLYMLGRPIAHMNFYDQAFTLLGDVDTARSAALVAKAENYMRVQSASADALPTHVPSFTKAEAHTKALMLQAEREALFASRKTRLTDITSNLDRQLSAEADGYRAQIQRVEALAEHLSVEWKKLISEELSRFEQLEIGGGTIPQAKPALRTDLFRKVTDVLETRDPARLWDLANDQKVIEAVQTPEWRPMWDSLRAELDSLRQREGRAATPDLVNQQEILRRTTDQLETAKVEVESLKAVADDLSAALKEAQDDVKKSSKKTGGSPEDLDAITQASPLANEFAGAIYSLDEAKRQVKALEGAKEKGIVKERQTATAFWKARIASLEKTVADLRARFADEASDLPLDPLLEQKLRLRAVRRAQGAAQKRLVELADQQRLSEEALTALDRDPFPSRRTIAEVESEALRTFQDRLKDWYAEALTPDEVAVAPATKPRLALVEFLRQKLETLDPRDALVLTPDELAALNTYRLSKLESPRPAAASALRKTAEALRKELADSEALRAKLQTFRSELDAARPDGAPIKLDADTAAALARKLDALEPETRGALLDGTNTPKRKSALSSEIIDSKHASLLPQLNDAELTARQAFQEALSDLRSQHQQILAGVLPRSSWELAAMSQAGLLGRIYASQVLRDASLNAAGYQNLVRLESHQWYQQLGRKLTPAERQTLMRDIATGKPSNNVSAQLMQRMRRRQLDQLLKIGAISPEFYHSLLRQDYYHGHFDRATRAQLADAQQKAGPLGSVPARFTRMMDDPGVFKFKIPEKEGTFWTAWKDAEGRVHHKADFPTLREAEAFLDTLPDSVREANLYKAWSYDQKLVNGLIGDVAVSHLNVMEALGKHVAVHQLSSVIARSGKVLPADAFPAAVGNVYRDPKGTGTWYRLDNQKVPHLAGKWMHESGVVWLHEAVNGWNFLGDVAKLAMQDLPIDNRLASPGAQVLRGAAAVASTGIRVAQNALAIGKIALSPRAWAQGIITNMVQSWMAGIPFTPKGMAARLRLLNEYRKQAKGKTDAYYNDLVRAGSILPDSNKATLSTKEGFAHILDDSERAWRSTEGLAARVAHIERVILDAELANNLELATQAHTEHARLVNLLADSTRTEHRSLVASIMDRGKAVLEETGRTLTGSRNAKASAKLWHIYQEGSLDNATKYVVYRYLVEEKGMTRADALAHTQSFLQHLHRVPQTIKNAVNRFGGAQFVTFPVEQARVLANYALSAPERLAGLMAFTFAWNLGSLSAAGVDEDVWYNGYAAQENVRRSPVTDFQAMMRGLVVPFASDTHRGLYQMSLGPLLWDFTNPNSPVASQLAQVLSGAERGNPGNTVARAAVSIPVGIATKFGLGEVGFATVAAILRGEDAHGNPVKSAMDAARMMYQTLAPDWLPGGRDNQTVSRILSGQDRDPRTGRVKGLLEYASRRLLSVQRVASEDQQLSAAIATQMHLSKRSATYTKSKSFDDLLATRIAREAYPGGKLSESAALDVTRRYYEDPENRPQLLSLDDDAPVDKVLSEAFLKARAKDASVPTLFARFNDLSVDDMVASYALFRAMYPSARPETVKTLEDAVTKKLRRYSGAQKDSLQDLITWAELNGNSPSLPPEVQQKIDFWRRRARTLPVQSQILR